MHCIVLVLPKLNLICRNIASNGKKDFGVDLLYDVVEIFTPYGNISLGNQ